MRISKKTGRAGLAIVFAVGLTAQMAAAESDKPKPEVCTKAGVMTLTGKIRSLQSMREEPQAEMQTFFYLDLPEPLCGKTAINASMMGLIPCVEGDTITMTGDFSPPDKMFDMAFFRGHGITACSAAMGAPAPEARQN